MGSEETELLADDRSENDDEELALPTGDADRDRGDEMLALEDAELEALSDGSCEALDDEVLDRDAFGEKEPAELGESVADNVAACDCEAVAELAGEDDDIAV